LSLLVVQSEADAASAACRCCSPAARKTEMLPRHQRHDSSLLLLSAPATLEAAYDYGGAAFAQTAYGT